MGEIPDLNLIAGYQPFAFDQLQVQPVAVPHDAREPAQFVFSDGRHKLGLLTDLGSLSDHVIEHYSGCSGLILEANHDPVMLAHGPYPPSLKRRVAGQWGHLSNAQARHLLEQIDCQQLQHLVVAHISEKNNSLELVQREFSQWHQRLGGMTYACQDQGFDWLLLSEPTGVCEQAS